MRKTALHDVHQSESAGMAEYHGWLLPAHYGSPEREYDAATRSAALLDQSIYGKLEISGRDAIDLLHRLSTNDFLSAPADRVVGTVLTTDKGKIVDYAKVVIGSPALMIVSPGNEEIVKHWIEKYTIMEDVTVRIVSDDLALFTFVGPHAGRTIESMFGRSFPEDVATRVERPEGEVRVAKITTPRAAMAHILAPIAVAPGLWREAVDAGAEAGVVKIGMEAYEAYRISRGIPSVGTEITGEFNPYEAGLVDVISYTKGCYIGQEVIARIDAYQKVRRKPYGLLLPEPLENPRASHELRKDGVAVGVLTSASPVRIHSKFPAFAIARTDKVVEGDALEVVAGRGLVHCLAISTPILLPR